VDVLDSSKQTIVCQQIKRKNLGQLLLAPDGLTPVHDFQKSSA
jgi:hypothetical protein